MVRDIRKGYGIQVFGQNAWYHVYGLGGNLSTLMNNLQFNQGGDGHEHMQTYNVRKFIYLSSQKCWFCIKFSPQEGFPNGPKTCMISYEEKLQQCESSSCECRAK